MHQIIDACAPSFLSTCASQLTMPATLTNYWVAHFLHQRCLRFQRKHEGELRLTNRRHSSAGSVLPVSAAIASTAKGFFGNFDDSRYWDYAFRLTNKGDMGHHCRECKQPFSELNKAIAVRRYDLYFEHYPTQGIVGY